MLLAVLVMPFAMLAPLFLLHTVRLPLLWLVFAVGAVLTLALSGAIYLFTTPLYRKGSVAARWDTITFLTFLAVVTIVAMMNTDFDHEAKLSPDDFGSFRIGKPFASRDDTERITSSMNYGEARMQQAFKDALDKAGIPYKLETREGKEFIGWTRAQDAAVRKIQRQVEGADLQPGRSVAFDDSALQKEFSVWLTKKGVKHETVKAQGREYIIWEGSNELVMQFMRERPSDCEKTAAAAGASLKKCG